MLTDLLSLEKSAIPAAADTLTQDAIAQLIPLLSQKDDKVRYPAFLLLQERARRHNDVYPYWHVFTEMLVSKNSFQRNIGVNLIAANAKWDDQNLLDQAMDSLLALTEDEKPITIRQCIQALPDIIAAKSTYGDVIAQHLMQMNVINIRESMRKLVLFDILGVLAVIKKHCPNVYVDDYITAALNGDILTSKQKKELLKTITQANPS